MAELSKRASATRATTSRGSARPCAAASGTVSSGRGGRSAATAAWCSSTVRTGHILADRRRTGGGSGRSGRGGGPMADVAVLGAVACHRGVTGGKGPELLGGKGAHQAVALAQLGVPVALVGVVGDDDAGREVLAQATADGIDVGAVVVRPGSPTAVLTHPVGRDGSRRPVEDVPPEMLLTADDVAGAADQIASCQALVLQLQQPGAAVRAAVERVPDTAVVVSDGAPEDAATREAVLRRADVVRAGVGDAALLVGRELDGVDDARDAADAAAE